MGRGYSGNHPRFSGKQDERYDAKEAYNKDLTASARLHYLENDRHDHESPAHSHCSPMHRHTDAHMRRQAKRIARRTKGDEQDIYYEMKSKKMNDERSSGKSEFEQEKLREEMDRMIDERGGSPMNVGKGQRALDSIRTNKLFFQNKRANDERGMTQLLNDPKLGGYINQDAQDDLAKEQAKKDEITRALMAQLKREGKSDSPMKMEGKGCAKSEGGSGCVVKRGGEFVILNNKKGGVWRSGFASKAAADKVLSAYHANK